MIPNNSADFFIKKGPSNLTDAPLLRIWVNRYTCNMEVLKEIYLSMYRVHHNGIYISIYRMHHNEIYISMYRMHHN